MTGKLLLQLIGMIAAFDLAGLSLVWIIRRRR